MKEHISRTFISLIIIASMFTACTRGQDTNMEAQQESVQIEETRFDGIDTLGREISLGSRPERIIIAGKSAMIAADALYLFPDARDNVEGLGLTDQGLGDLYSYLAPDFDATDRLQHTISAEEIAAFDPELVIMKSRNFQSLGKQLETLGIAVFTLDLETPEDYSSEIIELGRILGESDRAEVISAYFASMIGTVTDAVASIEQEEKERVLMLYCSIKDGITAFQVPPASWIQTSMTEMAGASAVWKEEILTNNWQKVSFEQIAAWDPDRIYIISYKVPANVFVEDIKRSQLWKSVQAEVKAFPADFHSWAQPDTRWILGLNWLYHDLHGANDDFSEELHTFYRTMYDIEDEKILDEIVERYETSL